MVTGLGMSCSRSNGCGRETRAPCVKIELFVSANDMPRGLSFSRKCFFFTSRGPHTSWNCDWSSDVCSSDLARISPYRYLLRHRGRVVPQHELDENVYGRGQEHDSNALEVLVRRVRKKLGQEVIETRRGLDRKSVV